MTQRAILILLTWLSMTSTALANSPIVPRTNLNLEAVLGKAGGVSTEMAQVGSIEVRDVSILSYSTHHGCSGDLNSDGRPDLLLPGLFSLQAILATSVAGSPFSMRSLPLSPDAGGTSLACGDVDGDGMVDILLGGTEPVRIMKGTGPTPHLPSAFNGPEYPFSIERPGVEPLLADLNKDGRLDLVEASYDRHLFVRLNSDSEFGAAVELPIYPPGFLAKLEAADVDQDGNVDLVFATEESLTEKFTLFVWVARGDGLGGFSEAVNAVTAEFPAANQVDVTVGDLSQDGRADVVLVLNGRLHLFAGDGAGNFQTDLVGTEFKLLGLQFDEISAVLDVNGDGFNDLVLSSLSYDDGRLSESEIIPVYDELPTAMWCGEVLSDDVGCKSKSPATGLSLLLLSILLSRKRRTS